MPTFTKRCLQIRLDVNNSSISSIRELKAIEKFQMSFTKPIGKSLKTPPGLKNAECILAPETRS